MSAIFAKMADRKIPIDMVVQDVGTGGLAEVSFTVPESDLAETLTAANEAVTTLGSGNIAHGTHVAKVSAVGVGMRTHSGVAAHMFQALADAGVNIGMVTTSDIKISVLVNRDACETALNAVHGGFALDRKIAASPAVGEGHSADPPLATAARDAREREVVSSLANMEDIVVSEVQLDSDQSRVTVRNIPDQPGVSARVFGAVARAGVMVDMIVQNVSHAGEAHLSFTVPAAQLARCVEAVEEAVSEWEGAELHTDADIAKLTVMGIGLRSHTGVGETMFRALAEAGFNIQLINTSEIRMSAVVAGNSGPDALKCLLEAFGLDK
jgi:aspartate kinase